MTGRPADHPSPAAGVTSRPLRVLWVTNMWPTADSWQGIFVAELADAMRRRPDVHIDVEIIVREGRRRSDHLLDNRAAWDISDRPLHASKTVDLEDLIFLGQKTSKRMAKRNNRVLMRLASLPPARFGGPLTIHVSDIGQVQISVTGG